MHLYQAKAILLLDAYGKAGLDPWPTPAIFKYLMYLLQASGDDLHLGFSKGPLDIVSNAWVNDMCRRQVQEIDDPVVGTYLKVRKEALELAQTMPSIDRVNVNRIIELIDGWETPFGLQLLCNVHWKLVKQESIAFPERSSINQIMKARARLIDKSFLGKEHGMDRN